MTRADSKDVQTHLKGILRLRKDSPGFNRPWRQCPCSPLGNRGPWSAPGQVSMGKKLGLHPGLGQPQLVGSEAALRCPERSQVGGAARFYPSSPQ